MNSAFEHHVAGNESVLEPYVDADRVAEHLSSKRREVLKLTRKGVITGYPISGVVRHDYRYKLSEVDRDIAKRRKPSKMVPGSPSDIRKGA